VRFCHLIKNRGFIFAFPTKPEWRIPEHCCTNYYDSSKYYILDLSKSLLRLIPHCEVGFMKHFHSGLATVPFLLVVCIIYLFGQAPAITSFTPISGPIGTTAGTNFNATAMVNKVHLGALKATVSTANSTQLIVTVPVCATFAPITVTDTTTGLTAYTSKPFVVTFSSNLIGCDRSNKPFRYH